MENKDYKLGSIVIMKKQHPCGTNEWEIVRVGADIKIKCLNCGRTVLIPRIEFNKKLKKVKEKEERHVRKTKIKIKKILFSPNNNIYTFNFWSNDFKWNIFIIPSTSNI